MLLTVVLLLASFVSAAPKLLICSDSTTANYSNSPLQGWGYFIGEYLSIPVINMAKNGRSTRSFIREGLWKQLLDKTSPGDFVVIEMGHNDDGDPTGKNAPNVDKASRATIRGTGNNTATGPLPNNKSELVHTFGWYLRTMAADVRAKQGIPIISGMVPRMSVNGGKFSTHWPFAKDAQTVAHEVKADWVDHTGYTIARWQEEGEKKVAGYFPQDKTHTNAAGARVNAETFVTAVRCAKVKLGQHFSKKGEAVKQKC